jgi:hypothetical protein
LLKTGATKLDHVAQDGVRVRASANTQLTEAWDHGHQRHEIAHRDLIQR